MLPIYLKATPSITLGLVCNTSQTNSRWMLDIIKYLHTGDVLKDGKQAHKLCIQTTRFNLINNQLYKQSFGGSYLKCLSELKTKYVIAEVHKGVCSNHLMRRTLAHRAYTQEYYWPTMKWDIESYVRRCDQCQWHTPISHVTSEALNTIISSWSFAQWGMDIINPLPTGVAQKKFLLVATDHFSKWVEAEAHASIKDKDVSKFVWKNILCRFKIPRATVIDNDPQFDNIVFRTFCSELNIKNLYSTLCYPQSNRQVDVTNKTLLNALKKMLERVKRKWADELPEVL